MLGRLLRALAAGFTAAAGMFPGFQGVDRPGARFVAGGGAVAGAEGKLAADI